MTTIAKVRRIGNSRGILFNKAILEETGIKGTVKITVKNKVIMISAAPAKAKKWSDFKRVKKTVKEKTPFVRNKFDESDWTW